MQDVILVGLLVALVLTSRGKIHIPSPTAVLRVGRVLYRLVRRVPVPSRPCPDPVREVVEGVWVSECPDAVRTPAGRRRLTDDVPLGPAPAEPPARRRWVAASMRNGARPADIARTGARRFGCSEKTIRRDIQSIRTGR
jgi:hypothetical protein